MCFKFTVLLLRMLRGYVAHHRKSSGRRQRGGTTANIHSNLARLQVQCGIAEARDAASHEGSFQSEARSQNQDICGRQKSCTCKQKRQKKQLTTTVFEELKNHANMRTPKLSFDEDGNEGQREVLCDIRLMMKDMKNGCLEEGLGLTCSAEYFGDDVRVIEWKKKEEKLKRQDREDEPNDGSDGAYRGFQKNKNTLECGY